MTWIALVSFLGCAELGPGVLGSVLSGGSGLSQEEMAAGLREALELGVSRAVLRTGRRGGFSGDPNLRIELPDGLDRATAALRVAGMGWTVDEVEGAMNLVAEQAAAEAAPIFSAAISELTWQRAFEIWRGAPDAATEHLREATGESLRASFTPISAAAMEKVGLVRIYSDMAVRMRALGLLEDPGFELDAYVVDHSLAGLFEVLAQEEGRIRNEPAARTTELLRRVFGG